MNHEQKYNEALEKAKKIHDSPNASNGRKEWLESIFPELAESEDERIIEEIKFAVLQMPSEREDTRQRCLAYLEKQKAHLYILSANDFEGNNIVAKSHSYFNMEPKPTEQKSTVEKLREISTPADEDWFEIERKWEAEDNEDLRSFISVKFASNAKVIGGKRFAVFTWERFKDVALELINRGKEKQKEPVPIPDKFSGLKSLMLQYLQSAANRKDDSEIESDTDLWGRKILDYVWKYDEKQNEQKPEDGEEKFESIDNAFRRGREAGFHEGVESVCKPAEWRPFDKEILTKIKELIDSHFSEHEQREVYKDWLDEHISQPAEWSEDDEKPFNDVLSGLRYAYEDLNNNKSFDSAKDIKEAFDWMQARVKNFRPQPKQEWSEEDEKMRCNILNALTPNLVYSCGKGTSTGTSMYKYDEEIKWLKSLRPSWKPSEEQMMALHEANIRACGTSYGLSLSELELELNAL